MEWKAIVRHGSNAMKQVCHHRPLMGSNCQMRVSSCESAVNVPVLLSSHSQSRRHLGLAIEKNKVVQTEALL